MEAQPDPAQNSKRRQWLWFAGLWCAGLFAALGLGYGIKFLMSFIG